ncbi:hypothetical protein TNCV_1436331 [Trichonephila clavipes]|nr:hypothetical protein TNCV_1436331 [Trichonephila clavipes]
MNWQVRLLNAWIDQPHLLSLIQKEYVWDALERAIASRHALQEAKNCIAAEVGSIDCDIPSDGDTLSSLLTRPMSEGRKEERLKSAILKSVYYDLS